MIDTIVYVYDQAYMSGGAAKIVMGEAIEMKKRGYRVIFFSAVGPIEEELLFANIEVVCLGEKHIAQTKNLFSVLKAIYNPKAYKSLTALLRSLDRRSTIVHVHGWTKALSCSVFIAAKDMEFKTFVTLHEYFRICQNGGLYNFKKKEVCKKKPGSFECMMCNCDKRNYFQKLYRNVRQIVQNMVLKKAKPFPIFITEFSEKIIQPYLPYNSRSYKLTNHVEIEDSLDRYNVEKNDIYFFIGRISQEKGIDLFCKAITTLEKKGIVIGSGSQLEEYKRKYPEIEFVGWKNRIEMKEYLNRARALVVTSKLYETMGLTIIEMQQYGIPCIVPRQCAGSEYVEHGETGILYEIDSLESLIAAIRESENSELLKAMSINFQFRLDTKKFSVIDHCDNLIEVYLA